jgi:hypothetical protein
LPLFGQSCLLLFETPFSNALGKNSDLLVDVFQVQIDCPAK